MGLDTNFAKAENTVFMAELEAELAKMEYVQVRSSETKRIRTRSLKTISRRALTLTLKP
jgi:hypothetical protein